jgi:hypothetical protein
VAHAIQLDGLPGRSDRWAIRALVRKHWLARDHSGEFMKALCAVVLVIPPSSPILAMPMVRLQATHESVCAGVAAVVEVQRRASS